MSCNLQFFLGAGTSAGRTVLVRRAVACLFVSALALAPSQALPAALNAPASGQHQFERTGMEGPFDPAILPTGADLNQTVTVVVELNEAPVGVTGASAEDLAKRQEPVKSAIAGQGGNVLHQYQYALNGFAVQIARGNAPALARLANVSAVKLTRVHEVDNAQSVPFIGAPSVWQGVDGFRGEGIKIGIIDTGIDYTHANFGGPGTADAYTAAHSSETQPADPKLFGPNSTTKVKGGTDLVGDAYDAGSPDPALRVPHPDPNPLDCHGHGSHVAGTAAGFGVTDPGATYTGPYDQTTPTRKFRIGPGVAPRADLYAIRVFGCAGSVSGAVIISALDWAVKHKLDMVNLSLGSPFGTSDDQDPEVDAVDNASRAGVLVVASAGNNGPSPYITGRPASAKSALSVAALDSKPEFPGVAMALSTGQTIKALNANAANLPGGPLQVFVLRDASGNVSLGCSDADYPGAVSGKLVVSRRGVCARVDRAILAQKHGASAAAMLNTDPGYPPYEAPIGGVTIPFLGIRGTLSTPGSDSQILVGADGGTATLSPVQLANPTFRNLASFTSGGPRFGDSFLKPEVSAPGVSIASTAIGTGNGVEAMSGTSMAAPHVTGLAALVRQAHASWRSVADLKQAIVNTALPAAVTGYSVRLGGAGLVQALPATRTIAVAFGEGKNSALNFGFASDTRDLRETTPLRILNHGSRAVTFELSTESAQGAPHSVSFQRSLVTVPARGGETLDLTLRVPVRTIGNADAFREVGGVVTLTPTTPDGNGGIALRVPYYLVPRALSNIESEVRRDLDVEHPQAKVRVTNRRGGISGTADFYAWGLVDDQPLTHDGEPFELRSAGVQSFADSAGRQVVVFALNTRGRWSNAAPYEFDVLIQANGHVYQVFGLDFGLVTTGTADGRVGSFVFDPATGKVSSDFFAQAPTDTNTILLPVFASRLGLTAEHPRFDYVASSHDVLSTSPTPDSVLPGQARFNAFDSAISTGQFVQVEPNAMQLVDVSLNPTEAHQTPAKGLMIVSLDNDTSHGAQVELISVPMGSADSSPAARTGALTISPNNRGAAPVVRPPRLSPAR